MIAEGLQGFMTIDSTNVDDDENRGLPEVYEFFTRYVRRIHPDTHWKRTMKINANKVFFQLVTPSDIAFVISLLKNGMPVWKRKKVLFETEEMKKTKAKPLFTSGEGQKRSFGKTTWSKEGLKYFHKVERTWQEAYSNKEQMCALINGWERWEPDGDLKKGKELLSTNWRIVEMNKKAKGRREGGEDDNDDDSDDDNGYHSDKYDDVEELPFRLDNGNLRKVTGLDCEIAEEEECEKGDENNDEEDGAGENGDDEDNEVGAENEKKRKRSSDRHKYR